MAIISFIQSVRRLTRVIRKPNRKEAWLLIKISIMGVAALGIVGFIVKALSWILGLSPSLEG